MNRAAAGWLSLAVLSQAASHQLVNAGNAVGYQHYPPVAGMLRGNDAIFLALLAVQAAAVGTGIVALRRRSSHSGVKVPLARILAVLVPLSLLGATFSSSPVVYGSELALSAAIQLAAIGNILLFAVSLDAPSASRAETWADRLLGEKSAGAAYGVDRFSFVTAAVVTIVAALLSVLSYERHPHVPDEVVYLINAEYFAQGRLFLTPPAVRAPFDVDLMMMTAGKWFVPVPPAWPLVLAAGVAAGIPWLVNPVLAGVCVLLSYSLLRELYPRRTARLALLLLGVSPWYLFMGMNFMTHMLALAFALCAGLCAARLLRTNRLGWAIPSGAAIGALTLVRPLEAVVIALLVGMWVLLAKRIAALAIVIASCGFVASANLIYNAAITGSPTTFPMSVYIAANYTAGANDLGFGANRGLGWPGLDPLPGHGALDVIVNAGLNAFSVNIELFGWATGSLLLIFALLAFGRMERADWMMLTAALSVAAIHSFYWFSGGPDFGARYWFLMIVPCAALSARGVSAIADVAEKREWPNAFGRTFAAVSALCLMSVLTFIPWRAVDKYHNYRRMRADIPALARANSFGEDLVLVRGRRHPDYASAAVYSSLFTGAPGPVYAWARDHNAEAAARAAFPTRKVWIVDGPTVTGRAFEIVSSDTTRSSR